MVQMAMVRNHEEPDEADGEGQEPRRDDVAPLKAL
jgi:hypothetical protein